MTKNEVVKNVPMSTEMIEILVPTERDENVNLTLASSGVRLEYQLWRMGAVQSVIKLSQGDKGIKHWSKNQCLELRRALMECAAAGAIPTRHVYLTPYWSKELGHHEIKVLSSYRFVIERMAAKGILIHPPQLIHQADLYEEEHTYNHDGAQIAVKFRPAVKDRGPVIAAFVCWTQQNLGENGEILASNTYAERKERDYFDKIRQFTERTKKGARSGPFADEMWRVSLVHRVRKWVREGLPVLSGDVLLDGDSAQELPEGQTAPALDVAVEPKELPAGLPPEGQDAEVGGKVQKEPIPPNMGKPKATRKKKEAPAAVDAGDPVQEKLPGTQKAKMSDPGAQPAAPEGEGYESPF